MEAKVSEQLNQVLESKAASDFVDVIIELHPAEEDDATAAQTRTERIAYAKEAFDRKIVPLEATIKTLGGEITGRAWINDTVRVRVPADKVNLLSGQEEIAKLDVPHSLVRDTLT